MKKYLHVTAYSRRDGSFTYCSEIFLFIKFSVINSLLVSDLFRDLDLCSLGFPTRYFSPYTLCKFKKFMKKYSSCDFFYNIVFNVSKSDLKDYEKKKKKL